MNCNSFLLNALVNDLTIVKVLIDSGWLYSGIIDDELTTQISLPRFFIHPRQLQTAEESS